VGDLARLLDAAAAANMRAWVNSGFSVDASVRITLIDRDVRSYFQSLEHLLRYCARPPFALDRLSVIRGPNGRITRVRYVLPRHKAANWVRPGHGRKSTRPGANGVIELTPFAGRMPVRRSSQTSALAATAQGGRGHGWPCRRKASHGVFAPNHKLRRAVTALAIGNVGKQRDATISHPLPLRDGRGERDATISHPLPLGEGRGEGAPNHAKPRSHDTSRIAWAKLLARVGEEFPLACPNCGGDIRLISFITDPGPIHATAAGRSRPPSNRRFARGRRPRWLRPREAEPPPISPAGGPPTFTASDRCRTRGIKDPDGRPGRRSAPRRENLHSGGRAAIPGAADWVPGNAAPDSPAAHRLGYACGHRCGSAIRRTILRTFLSITNHKPEPQLIRRFKEAVTGGFR
jgi:hypothetical protein